MDQKLQNVGLFLQKFPYCRRQDRDLKINLADQIRFLCGVRRRGDEGNCAYYAGEFREIIESLVNTTPLQRNHKLGIPPQFFPLKEYDHYLERFRAMLDSLKDSGFCVQRMNAKISWRLAIGLGSECVYETNITLHRNYSVPIIPGSAIKGVAHHYAVKKKHGKIREIFGEEKLQGKVIFFDALPIINLNKEFVVLDVMNVHYPDYYQKEMEPPGDWMSPNPIFFLAVEGISYEFTVASTQVDLANNALEIVKEAIQKVGIGAKTNAGYGYLRYEEGSPMKILVAPWGNPALWNEVTYIFRDRQVKSNTSLRILQEVINPDKTIIIGSETIGTVGESYQKVVEEAREKINKCIESFKITQPTLYIAPGVGKFENCSFYGNLSDYYYFILTKFCEELLDIKADSDVEVHLDLTHGINYMPVLTYRALRELLEIFAFFSSKVRLCVYNAEPLVSRSKDQTLSIHTVEEAVITPNVECERVEQANEVVEPTDRSEEYRKKFFTEDVKFLREEINLREISAFVSGLKNGLPLVLFTFYPSLQSLQRAINNLWEIYQRTTELTQTDRLTITKKVRFSEGYKTLLIAFVIATLLKNQGLVTERKTEVKIEEVEKITEKILRHDMRAYKFIQNDLYGIKQECRGCGDEWSAYPGHDGPPDARNFFAHSGFERNTIEVKMEGNTLFIRYSKKSLEAIRNFCCQALYHK